MVKRKSLLYFLLGVSLFIHIDAFAQPFFEEGGVFYYIQDEYACVTYKDDSFGSYSGEVLIPSKVEHEGNTYEVKKIGNSAFKNCSELTIVSLPATLESIGTNAFEKCIALQSIDIPKSVEIIGSQAFYQCSSLTSITIPSSVKEVCDGAFSLCDNLNEIIFKGNPKIGAMDTEAKLILSIDDADAVDFGLNPNTFYEATINRPLEEGKYGTIVFPFELSDETLSDYVFYELIDSSAEGLVFLEVDYELFFPAPGQPYLYRNANGRKADKLKSKKNAFIHTLAVWIPLGEKNGGWWFKGTFSNLYFDDAGDLEHIYFLSNNKIMNASRDVSIAPFRAFFEGPVNAKAPSLTIRNACGETTRIDAMSLEEIPASCYDLAGRPVKALEMEKGIFIVNGKKYLNN